MYHSTPSYILNFYSYFVLKWRKRFLEQIGPSIRRSHINEKLCCELWVWVSVQQWQEWNIITISIENYLTFIKFDILSNIERKMRDEEIEVWKLLIANLISWLQNKMSAQKWSECEIYIKKWSEVRMWIFSFKNTCMKIKKLFLQSPSLLLF